MKRFITGVNDGLASFSDPSEALFEAAYTPAQERERRVKSAQDQATIAQNKAKREAFDAHREQVLADFEKDSQRGREGKVDYLGTAGSDFDVTDTEEPLDAELEVSGDIPDFPEDEDNWLDSDFILGAGEETDNYEAMPPDNEAAARKASVTNDKQRKRILSYFSTLNMDLEKEARLTAFFSRPMLNQNLHAAVNVLEYIAMDLRRVYNDKTGVHTIPDEVKTIFKSLATLRKIAKLSDECAATRRAITSYEEEA